MEKLYDYLPRELVTFLLVTVFSLLIGLSQRKISLKREGETTLFGTDRTFTFIGILGYLLYILDPTGYRLFMGGGAILGLLLGLNYYVKQSQYHVFGVTTIIIALITYCIAPIVATQPSWFYVMVIVTDIRSWHHNGPDRRNRTPWKSAHFQCRPSCFPDNSWHRHFPCSA